MAAGGDNTFDVFINCPYDSDYARTFEALIFAVHALGFRARAAREVDDGADNRLDKIIRIIGECRYGIHDISRTELDEATGLPRFNMPFELGIFVGARKLGGSLQKKKVTLILDVELYRYREFISDLAGMDPHAHGGEPKQAIQEVRNWLATASRNQLPSANIVLDQYVRFEADLPAIVAAYQFDRDAILYADFVWIVAEWLGNEGRAPEEA